MTPVIPLLPEEGCPRCGRGGGGRISIHVSRLLTQGRSMAEKKDAAYFMYFPGNYRWSAAFINMIGSIAYGGAEIGELHKIGRMLKEKGPEDDAARVHACVKVADGVRGYAEKWERQG